VRENVPCGFGAAVAVRGERGELGIADADHRQFRHDKKGVQQHQHQHGEDFQRDQNDGGRVHFGFLRILLVMLMLIVILILEP
jgi:hypothetical protein